MKTNNVETIIQTHLIQAKGIVSGFSVGIGIFLTCLILGYAARFFSLRFERKFSKAENFGGHALFKAIANPICFLLIFMGLFLAIDALKGDWLLPKVVLATLKKSLVVLCSVWAFTSYIGIYEKKYHGIKGKSIPGMDRRTIDILIKLGKAITLLIASMFLMDICGVNIRGILAVVGIGGASIVFAAKDLLTNFLGVIMIYIEKPFSIGDEIKLPNGTRGTVEYIGWQATKIKTFEATRLCVANSTFSTMLTENLSNITHRKITQVINLRYADINKLESITKEIRTMLLKHPEIDNEELIICSFSEFAESSVNFKVLASTKILNKVDFAALQQQIVINIAKIINKHKAQMAFPTRTVEMLSNCHQ